LCWQPPPPPGDRRTQHLGKTTSTALLG
jgi:hypothetical protein